MRRLVVLSTAAGSGNAADDARLAALALLLRRRSQTPLVAVTPQPTRVLRAHPDLHCIDDAEFGTTLAHADLVCVSVASHGDPLRLERAAQHAAMARLAGVPVAWVAADCADGAGAAASLLAGVESVSASDAESAAVIAALRGRRVEVVAVPELVDETEVVAPALRRGRIALDAAFLDALDAAASEALRAALRAFAPRAIVVLGDARRVTALAEFTRIEPAPASWPAWQRALASCQIVVTGDALGVAAAALAAGVVPVVATTAPVLLARVALHECAIRDGRDSAAWARALAAAAHAATTLPSRVAPLRALAWRGLGVLADAARNVVPDPAAAAPASRRIFARACADLAAPALAAGDAAGAERVLDAWGDVFDGDPAWAEARARADALLGRDADAVARLQRAAVACPDDARVHAALARAWLRRGDWAAALGAWQRCAELQPHAAEPWAEMAQLALAGGRVSEALTALAAAQAREPGHAASVQAVRALFAAEAHREAEFWRQLHAANTGVTAFAELHRNAAARAGQAAPAAVAAGPASEV